MARVAKNNDNNEKKEKSVSKSTTSKKSLPKEKNSTTKSSIKNSKKSTTSSKKATTSSKKSTTKKPSKRLPSIISEHYDLPNKYDKTFIVLLAQSPKTLFAFWEISDLDKSNLTDKYGSHFFENTRPILAILNKTTNKYFEIEINDYATDWYIDVEDTNCEFEVQLGRKPYGSVVNDFILIANSNSIESPNDHILLEKLPKTFKFLNLKTNEITQRSLNNGSFSQIYNIYNFYQEIYKDELYNNPSSK